MSKASRLVLSVLSPLVLMAIGVLIYSARTGEPYAAAVKSTVNDLASVWFVLGVGAFVAVYLLWLRRRNS